MIKKLSVVLTFLLINIFATFLWLGTAQGQQENSTSSIIDLSGGADVLPCGNRTISIARMQWPSSIVLAHIHAIILTEQLGCRVEVIAGDMAATASSMVSTGEPAIAPELWVTRITQIWNGAIETGRIRIEGVVFSGGATQGWFLPPQLAEKLPDLFQVKDLRRALVSLNNPHAQNDDEQGQEVLGDESAQVEVVQTPNSTRIKFISCPPDWACSVINKNLLTAYGLTEMFELVEPANRFEMDTLIAQSVSRQEMIVFYYWQPNAVLAQFDFVALDMGGFEEENFKCLAQRNCVAPKPSSFANEKAFIVASDWVSQDAPLVAQYLGKAILPLKEMNRMLNWQAEGAFSFEELAARFVSEREEIWRPWVAGVP